MIELIILKTESVRGKKVSEHVCQQLKGKTSIEHVMIAKVKHSDT